MTVLMVTISDDRSGRKGGEYGLSQDRALQILKDNPHFGVNEFKFWKWADIQATSFYQENKALLDQTNPAMNGRCYKPYIILEGLKALQDGDFLVYNDVSPEIWLEMSSVIDPNIYSIEVLKNLCLANNGIVTAEAKWHFIEQRGDHTHENFTFEQCIERMGMMDYKYYRQHASGMIAVQKSQRMVDFVTEWLHWNVIPECASLGPIGSGTVYPFLYPYLQEETRKHGKIGHRHDQSISGLLLCKMEHRMIKDPLGYNILHFCRKDHTYSFLPCKDTPGKYKYRVIFDGEKHIQTETLR